MRTTYCKNCNKTTRFYSDFGPGKGMIYICGECDTDLNNNFKFERKYIKIIFD